MQTTEYVFATYTVDGAKPTFSAPVRDSLENAQETAEKLIKGRDGVRKVRIYACVGELVKVEGFEWTKKE